MDTLRPPQALLQTALVIVDRDGVDALTVRTLVRESGVSNGSVYHHVGSLDRLRSLVADEALQDWADSFLQALHAGGFAAAVAADLTWSRQHPALAELVETESQHGRLGSNAIRFSQQLRRWLNDHHLALGAPAHLVSAIVIGPLTELRRITRGTDLPSTADLDALDVAVTTALRALNGDRTNDASRDGRPQPE